MYCVKNQGGFNRALYDFKGPDNGNWDNPNEYSKKELRQAASSYPKHYPALISLEDNMFEIHRIGVSVAPANIVQTLFNTDNWLKDV